MSDSSALLNGCVFRITIFDPSCLERQENCLLRVDGICPTEQLLVPLSGTASLENDRALTNVLKRPSRKVSPPTSDANLQSSPVALPSYQLSTEVSLSRVPDQPATEETLSDKQSDKFWAQISKCAENPSATCASKLQALVQNELTADTYWVLVAAYCRSEGTPVSDECVGDERSVEQKRANKTRGIDSEFPKSLRIENCLKELSKRGKQQTLARVVQKLLNSADCDRQRELTAKSRTLLENWKVKIGELRALAKSLQSRVPASESQQAEELSVQAGSLSCQRLRAAISDQQSINRTRIENLVAIADQRKNESFSSNFSYLTAVLQRVDLSFAKTDTPQTSDTQTAGQSSQMTTQPYFSPCEYQIERLYFEQQKQSKQLQLTRNSSSLAQTQVYRPSKDTCQVCENEISYDENLLVYCSVISSGVQHRVPPKVLRFGGSALGGLVLRAVPDFRGGGNLRPLRVLSVSGRSLETDKRGNFAHESRKCQ